MAAETSREAVEALPFVAPCRKLPITAPFTWLRAGLADFAQAWPQSLAYGALMASIMGLVAWLAWHYGSYWFMLAMLGGFVFLAPLVCTGLYALSDQLARGQPPSLAGAMAVALRHVANEMVFTLVLLVVFLVWARAATLVSVFMPTSGQPHLRDLVAYLAVGTAIGAVFAAITFSVSAFSLPMIVHRRIDAVTAVITSINAVLNNRGVMLLWLGLIVLGIVVGVATAFVGLAVILPIIGHASWHAYLQAIDASGFPAND
jgi:uncharacterized membrane protein